RAQRLGVVLVLVRMEHVRPQPVRAAHVVLRRAAADAQHVVVVLIWVLRGVRRHGRVPETTILLAFSASACLPLIVAAAPPAHARPSRTGSPPRTRPRRGNPRRSALPAAAAAPTAPAASRSPCSRRRE